MRPGSRRALFGVISVSAVLLPAVGMTYLGVSSYSSDRGVVAAKVDEQLRVAQSAARAVEGEIEAALDAVEATFSRGAPTAAERDALAARHALARRPFWVAASGVLAWPRAEPLASEPPLLDSMAVFSRGPSTCPETAFDSCVRSIRSARRRARQLADARNDEIAGDALRQVRRTYVALARFPDTAPAALLGLARLHRGASESTKALAIYRDIADQFPTRQAEDGVSFGLLADLGSAELTQAPADMVAVYRGILEGKYVGSAPALFAIAEHVRAVVRAHDSSVELRAAVDELDATFDAFTQEAALARSLTREVDDVVRSASRQLRGRAALDGSDATVVYRRTADGGIAGVVVDNHAISRLASRLGPATRRIEVYRLGRQPDAETVRTLATASFGPALAHMGLALVNRPSDPDPLDEIVREQGRRHLWISGGLALVLIMGIAATIRNAARERELARLKSDFVSTVSHELKTPLTSVRMFAEMLQQGVSHGDREREARYHDIIVKESERLGLLIANLLDYSQVERGTRRYSEQVASPVELARESVATFGRFQEGNPPEIAIVDQGAEDAAIRVDREVLVQCILNLLSNASKYGGREQPITVSVRKDDGNAIIAVRDRGPGIAKAELGKIWDEFYRSPSAYSSGAEGTGLGLALVKRHVEAQGGTVDVASTPGQGATFSIVVPLANQAKESE